MKDNDHVIGDFTWTGWDYLGETGIGATRYADDRARPAFSGGFPELTAWCGDIDIVGTRRPVSYFREIVFGLRNDPYIAVNPPANHGRAIAVATPWAWGDAIASWTWDGFEGKPVTRRRLQRRGRGRAAGERTPRSVGRRVEGFRASFETTYRARRG